MTVQQSQTVAGHRQPTAKGRPALTLVTRYVLSEIIPLLIAGLTAVVLLFLLAAIFAVLAPLLAKGASPLLVAKLAAYAIPDGMSRGLPIALLFAVLLAMSRLVSDAEVKSLLAAGLSPLRLLWPALGLSVAVAAISFLNAETLVPGAVQRSLSTGREILLDNPRVLGLGEAGTILRDAFGRAITVDTVETGGRFTGVRIVQTQDGGPAREVITARRGQLLPGSAVLRLTDGQRVTFQGARPVTVATFPSADLPVQDLQANLDGDAGGVQPVNLPLRQLLSKLSALRATGADAGAELTALNRKFAEPLAALAFAFFGVALALNTFRSGASLGLVWVLLLTFAYYATWSVFRVMGEQGALPPVLAAWAPNTLYLVAGAVLLVPEWPRPLRLWAPVRRRLGRRAPEPEQLGAQLDGRSDQVIEAYYRYRRLAGEHVQQLGRLTDQLRYLRRQDPMTPEQRAEYHTTLVQAEGLVDAARAEFEAARDLVNSFDVAALDQLLGMFDAQNQSQVQDQAPEPSTTDAVADHAAADHAASGGSQTLILKAGDTMQDKAATTGPAVTDPVPTDTAIPAPPSDAVEDSQTLTLDGAALDQLLGIFDAGGTMHNEPVASEPAVTPSATPMPAPLKLAPIKPAPNAPIPTTPIPVTPAAAAPSEDPQMSAMLSITLRALAAHGGAQLALLRGDAMSWGNLDEDSVQIALALMQTAGRLNQDKPRLVSVELEEDGVLLMLPTGGGAALVARLSNSDGDSLQRWREQLLEWRNLLS